MRYLRTLSAFTQVLVKARSPSPVGLISRAIFLPLTQQSYPGSKDPDQSSKVDQLCPESQSVLKNKVHRCFGKTSSPPRTYPSQTRAPNLRRWTFWVHSSPKQIQLIQKLRRGASGDLRGKRSCMAVQSSHFSYSLRMSVPLYFSRSNGEPLAVWEQFTEEIALDLIDSIQIFTS